MNGRVTITRSSQFAGVAHGLHITHFSSGPRPLAIGIALASPGPAAKPGGAVPGIVAGARGRAQDPSPHPPASAVAGPGHRGHAAGGSWRGWAAGDEPKHLALAHDLGGSRSRANDVRRRVALRSGGQAAI